MTRAGRTALYIVMVFGLIVLGGMLAGVGVLAWVFHTINHTHFR